MKKKNIFLSIIILIILYFSISFVIGNNEYRFVNNIREKIPYQLRTFLKEKIFFISDLKSKTRKLSKENVYLRDKVSKLEDQILELKNFLNFISKQMLENEGYVLPAAKSYKKIKSKNGDYVYQLKKYHFTSTPWQFNLRKPVGYMAKHKNKIVIISGDAEIIYFDLADIYKQSLTARLINNNLIQLINDENITNKGRKSIRGILIHNDEIFVSYAKEIKKNCYNTSILKSKLDIKNLKFTNFFSYEECSNKYGNHSGGKMVMYDDENFLFTIGDAQQFIKAQDERSKFGKVLLININDGNSKLIAMGLRNSQGMYFHKDENVILLTDHGPTGGDEINIILENEFNNKINFGWPISTYGKIDYVVIKEHKYQNHEEHGFKEPLKHFSPSIAPSNIINVNLLNESFTNDFFVSTMGNQDGVGRKSIHHLRFDKNFHKIIFDDQIKIGERIRDILYLKENKIILLILEESPAIAALSLSK